MVEKSPPLVLLSALLVGVLALSALPSCKKKPRSDGASGAHDTLGGLSTACEKGKARACLQVASAYYQGRGAPQSFPQASHFFEQACRRGAHEGCFHLANMLEAGRGVKKDLPAAIKQYGLSCQGKVGLGCFRVGQFWYQGEGGRRDVDQAVGFFKKSCDVSHKYQGLSCFFVGQAFMAGSGVPRSLIQSAVYMKKSCGLGDRKGCAGLAALYETGRGGLKKDLTEARRLYEKSCRGGQLASCAAVKHLDQRPAPKVMTPAMTPAPVKTPPTGNSQ